MGREPLSALDRQNVLIAGGGWDRSRSDFAQSYQLGGSGADRGAQAAGAQTDIVDLAGTSSTASVYATDTYSPGGDARAQGDGARLHPRSPLTSH